MNGPAATETWIRTQHRACPRCDIYKPSTGSTCPVSGHLHDDDGEPREGRRYVDDVAPAANRDVCPGDGCVSCGELVLLEKCKKSPRACQHHCDCSWHGVGCCYCGERFDNADDE